MYPFDLKHLPAMLEKGNHELSIARSIRRQGYPSHMTEAQKQHHRKCMSNLAKQLIVWSKIYADQ